MAALVLETDENPVVKLPEQTNHMNRQPPLVDNVPPLGVFFQPPTVSFLGCEPTLTDSDVPEPSQCSVVAPLPKLIVRLPKLAEPQPANTAGLVRSTQTQRDDAVGNLIF